MKKKIYTKNSIPTNSFGCFITIDSRGRFTLSGELAEYIQADGKYIYLVQDEERPMDWFIEITDKQDGFKISKHSRDNRFSMHSKYMAKKLAISIDCELPVRLPVSALETEPNLYAIITKAQMKVAV